MPEPSSAAPQVVVVGAGVSGLTTAFLLRQAGLRVTVLEASDRVGGALTTSAEDGWLFEMGPNTVLENNEHVAPLLEAAGLASRKRVGSVQAKRRYLWKGDRLVALPGGPGGFLRTPLFSTAAKLRLLREPFVARPRDGREESIADFVRRRLGQEFLDYAVGPFVSGVYAGDPERLSVRWAVRKIAALEREHGSLIRGAFARRKGPAPSGAMITLDEGLEALALRLAERIGDVRTGTPVETVTREGNGYRVRAASGSIVARQVVLAVPADVLGVVLADLTGGQARAFGDIPYAPVAVVSLGFARSRVDHPLDGFGFLAPRRESLRILGCLFPSTIFPDRAPAGHVALSAFAGGRTNPEIVEWSDDRLVGLARDELGRALGARGEPAYQRVRRWDRAIPQYEVGHGRFVERAARIEHVHPGIHVGGNCLHGISVPDCIQNATLLAERVAKVSRSGGPPVTSPGSA